MTIFKTCICFSSTFSKNFCLYVKDIKNVATVASTLFPDSVEINMKDKKKYVFSGFGLKKAKACGSLIKEILEANV